MNLYRAVRCGAFFLLGINCAATLTAAAPVKLNAPFVAGRNVVGVQFSPDGSRVLYVADQTADEVFELFSVPSAGGTPVKLNGTPALGGDVTSDSPLFSPDGARVLYHADQEVNDRWEIFSVLSTGGTPVKLNGTLVAGGDVDANGLQFSPDGSQVLYIADQVSDEVFELFAAPSAGGTPVKLNSALVAGGDVSSVGLRFSPDGSHVLYLADQAANDRWEIFSVPSAGGTPVQLNGTLVAGGDVDANDLQFTPDGARVVYRADQQVDERWELFGVPSAGGTPVKLNGTLVANGDVSSGSVRVSSDGSRVLYRADQEVDERWEIYSVPSVGGTPVKLNGSLVGGGDVDAADLQFTPDGGRVVYRADQQVDEQWELFSVPSAGGTPVKLNGALATNGDVSGGSVQISPDSSRISYLADQDTNDVVELYSVPISGGTPVKLNGTLVHGGNVRSSLFSPDGSRILYLADQDTYSVNELYLVPSKGGTPVKINGPLTNGGDVMDVGLQFSPDGSRIVYLADQDTDQITEVYSRVVRQHWSAGSGDWTVASNWDHNVVPDEVMQIFVDQPGVVSIPGGGVQSTVNELHVGGGASNSTLYLAPGSSLSAVNGVTIDSGGIIQGEGSVAAEVVVLPGGMLAPGSSEGVLEINKLTMNADSLLGIEIGGTTVGTQYDRLMVNELATLAGSLSVSFVNSFLPSAGDSFTILECANLVGSFANVASGTRLDTLGGEGSFLVNYDEASDAVVLSDFLLSAGLTGDYNTDGAIDAADYTAWRDAMTTGATSLPNDPTPGSVDENDFLYWRAHFGQSVGSGAGSASALSFATAVPEPSSYALALLAISLALLQARFGCPNTLRCVQKLDQSPPSV